MAKIFSLFLFFVCAFAQAQPQKSTAQAAKPAPAQSKPAAQAQKPALSWCRLGADPVDSSRQPNWTTECVVKSTTATPVTMVTGSGRQVRCVLPPLTPLVVDRGTGTARWVLACGNPILSPANWVPQGTRICGPEQPAQPVTAAPAQAPAAAAPAPAPAASTTPQVHLEGEVRHVHSGEVRVVHETVPPSQPAPEPAPVQAPAPTPQPKKGWWARNAKWVLPVAIGAGTAAAIALTRGSKNNTVYYQPIPPPLYRP